MKSETNGLWQHLAGLHRIGTHHLQHYPFDPLAGILKGESIPSQHFLGDRANKSSIRRLWFLGGITRHLQLTLDELKDRFGENASQHATQVSSPKRPNHRD